jgi:hypothetical protein
MLASNNRITISAAASLVTATAVVARCGYIARNAHMSIGQQDHFTQQLHSKIRAVLTIAVVCALQTSILSKILYYNMP